jgi:hypothetical protein
MENIMNECELHFKLTHKESGKFSCATLEIVYTQYPTVNLDSLVDFFNKNSNVTETVTLDDLSIEFSYNKSFVV